MRAKWGSRGLRPPFGVSPNTSILLFCRRRRQEKGSAEGFPLLNAHAYGHPLWVPCEPLICMVLSLVGALGRLVLCSLPYVRFHKGKWHAVAVLDRGGQANHPPD